MFLYWFQGSEWPTFDEISHWQKNLCRGTANCQDMGTKYVLFPVLPRLLFFTRSVFVVVIKIPLRVMFFTITVHYPQWCMPHFMRKSLGLPHRLAQCMSLQEWDELVNAALLSLMRHVWMYAVLHSSPMNLSVLLVCRDGWITREAGHVGLMGRDQGRRGCWVTLYLFIYSPVL